MQPYHYAVRVGSAEPQPGLQCGCNARCMRDARLSECTL